MDDFLKNLIETLGETQMIMYFESRKEADQYLESLNIKIIDMIRPYSMSLQILYIYFLEYYRYRLRDLTERDFEAEFGGGKDELEFNMRLLDFLPDQFVIQNGDQYFVVIQKVNGKATTINSESTELYGELLYNILCADLLSKLFKNLAEKTYEESNGDHKTYTDKVDKLFDDLGFYEE